MLNLLMSKKRRMKFVVNRPKRSTRPNAEGLLLEAKNGKVSLVYVITGGDEVSRDKFFRKLVSFVVPDNVRDFNFNSYNPEGFDPISFKSTYESYPLMSPRRVLALHDCEKLDQASKEYLETILFNPIETSCILFVSEKVDFRLKLFKLASNVGSVIDFRVPYDKNLPQWIEMQARAIGIRLEPKAILRLQMYVGNSPGELVQELNKIAVCVSDKETVTEDLVRRFCSTTRGATVFELANAIGERNCQDALKLAETFLNTGNHPAIALKMIDRHYLLLLKAKAELEKGHGADEIAKVIGVHPFFARAYVDQSRSFSTSRIWRCLGILKEGDWQIRSYGRRLEKFVMDRMIVQLCAKPCNSNKN
ncbi:MAG: DNA polymerase III subunit delta [Gemmatimonadetes bacterium]|nr:DNA polymerase III subunit delta [Gemmatimonadota bacterium]